MPGPSEQDWTIGPAKWAMVLAIAAVSIAGMAWSITTRRPIAQPAPYAMPAPIPADQPPQPGRVIMREDSSERPPNRGAARPPALTSRLNVNTATAAELELLPGIGPALAGRIIDDREANGPFGSVDELDRVKGIGPKTLDRIRDLCAVE